MKIFKYTFHLPKLEVVNDELVMTGEVEETYTFTLLHKGMGIFEELSGKPLMAYLTEFQEEDINESVKKLLDKDFIPCLACASYVKIENGKFHNNRATAEEFRKSAAYPHLVDDLNFVTKLVEMAVECIVGDQVSKKKSDVASGKKL